MAEPIPKRAKLEVITGERIDIEVYVKTFECPLCMTTWDIMINGIPDNQRGHFEANCQNCIQWGRGQILCFIVA